MIGDVQELPNFDLAQSVGGAALAFFTYVIVGLLPACGVMYLIYFVLTLPMRRSERARMFLNLLEMGLKDGRSPEAAVTGPASSQDRSLGVRFHLLAAYLQQGVRFGQALDLAPRLLPPQVRAMLKAGDRIGDVSRVLPACRRFLQDAVSRVRGALNYVLLVAFAVTPAMVIVPLVINVQVLPKYREVFAGMTDESQLPAFTRLVFAENGFTVGLSIAVLLFLWSVVYVYTAGPPHRGWWLGRWMGPLDDWCASLVPWRRNRMQRDFSSMLAVLLDAEVPEADAVSLAAEATANKTMQCRAAKASILLREGTRLPEALRVMDSSPELQWRIANALKGGRGFLRALTGWHEALDARAFQLEQTGAQLMTTFLVLLNGLIVGSFVVAVFLALISLINHAVLW